jgi:putative tricarboxylic transport membrane protein
MRRALQISAGDVGILYATTLSKILYIVLILVIIGPFVWNFKKSLQTKNR